MNYKVVVKSTENLGGNETQLHKESSFYSFTSSFDDAEARFIEEVGSADEEEKYEAEEANSQSQIYLIESSLHSNGFSVVETYNIQDQDGTKLAFTSFLNFWIGIMFLVFMVVPCSMIGPLVIGLPSKSPFVSSAWRSQG